MTEPRADHAAKDADALAEPTAAAPQRVGITGAVAQFWHVFSSAWLLVLRDLHAGMQEKHARSQTFRNIAKTLAAAPAMNARLLDKADKLTERTLEAPPVKRVLSKLGPRPGFVIGLTIVILSLISGLSTGLILTGLTPILPTGEVVTITLVINFILILCMVGVIALQLRHLWRARAQQQAGSALHVRIVAMFAGVALVPALVLALFAWISLDRGLDAWFSDRTRQIVSNSLGVAEAYVQEHGQVLRTDALAMAADLDRASSLTEITQLRLSQQSALRSIPYAYLLNDAGQVVTTAAQTAGTNYLAPPLAALADAKDGDAIAIAPGRSNRVAAIKKLETFPGLYLFVARPVDPQVTRHLQQTRRGVSEYVQLERRRAGVQVAFGLMYLMIAMTLLLAAVWTGLSFANRLIVPIRQLIGAAERVSAGDLNAQVDTAHADGDLKQLSETFNNMTSELSTQHGQLLSTNAELAERRQFIEAVLAGVSAGVIHLNADGRVTLINRSAARHLPALAQMPEGAQLTEIRPEFAGVLDQLKRGQARALTPGATDDPAVSLGKAASLTAEHALQAQAQVTIDRGETKQTFAVIAIREWTGEEPAGTIVTFDDISDLVAAERIAAWADFARRVAHEIKNPLTPIQLSAQRLRRKYADEITSDPQTFEKCTTTIVQKVEEMKRMLNNFSAQGKMPDAVLVQDDLVDVVRDTLFLQSNAHSEISFTVELHGVDDAPVDIPMIGAEPQTGGPEHEIDLAAAAVAKHTSQVPRIVIDLDRSQLGQSLINLVKNGIEAIAAVHEAGNAPDGYRGAIRIEIHDDGPELTVAVIDNGCGLPKHDRAALVDPYVTHREKGTGLGLNIVMRTAEQHGGRLELTDAPYPVHGQLGAAIRIILPRDGKARLMQANTASDHSMNEQATSQTAAQNSGTGTNLHVAAE